MICLNTGAAGAADALGAQMDCEMIDGCVFFHDRMADMPGMADLYKTRYCKTDNSGCARHIVAERLGRGRVPGNLFPNEVERAAAIIGGE